MQPNVLEKSKLKPEDGIVINNNSGLSLQQVLIWIYRLKTLRFGLVSSITTIIDYLVLALILKFLPSQKPLAVASGYITGMIVHFFIARRFVFDATRHALGLEFLFVVLIGLTGLGLTEAIILPLNNWYGINIFFAKAVAIGIVFCWNFGARRYLIYNHRSDSQH